MRSLVALVGSQIMLVTVITGVLGRDAADFASGTVRVETVGDPDDASATGRGDGARSSSVALPADRARRNLIEYVPIRPDSVSPAAFPAAASPVPTTARPITAPTSTVAPTIDPSTTAPDREAAVAGTEATTTTGLAGLDDGLPSDRGQQPLAALGTGDDGAGPVADAGPTDPTTATTATGNPVTGIPASDDPASGGTGVEDTASDNPSSTTSSGGGTTSSASRSTTTMATGATTGSASTTTVPSAGATLSASTTTVASTSVAVTTSSSSATISASTSSSTAAKAPSTTPPTTAGTTVPPVTSGGPNAGLEALRNIDGRFGRFADVASVDLDLMALTEPALVPDNGTVGDGQFRAACQYSHFAYDDPIVYPGQSGRSHLHMFFGNTAVDANTTTPSLVDSGGSTCNGFELNRSGYWTPALLDGRGNAVVPEMIVLYYKTKQPERVERMPQGLKMIAGNTTAESFTASQFLFWSCGDSGGAYAVGNRIPDCGGDTFNATIVFPQCWDGRNLDSADHRSHMALVSPHADCPASHPVRLPQISILLYFAGQDSVDGWHLSSDRRGGFNTGPGATLHADWWGGWNDDAMDLWIDGCMKAARNCSFGQTGTDRVLAKLNAFQNYAGPYLLPLP